MNNAENAQLNNQEIKEGRLVLKSYPREVWLSVTNKCNLRCAHCKIGRPEKGVMRDAPRLDMSDELFEKIKTQVFPFVNKIIFGGTELSEQLFCKRWDYIFDQTAKFPLEIHIITNGTLLTEERIKKFVEREAVVSVSIESVKPELYKAVRGKSYDGTFELVKYGNELKKKLGKDKAVIKFGVTLFRDNIYELTDMIKFAHNLGVSEINTGHLCPQYENQREQSLVYHKDIYNRIHDEAISTAKELNMYLDLPPKFYIPGINENKVSAPIDTLKKFCYWPWNATSIDQEGKVTPCCGSGSLMGDLSREDFLRIWNGKKYEDLRRRVNSKDAPDYCRDCIVRADGYMSNAKMLSAIGMGKGFSLKKEFLLNLRENMMKNILTKGVYNILEKIYKKIT